MSSTNIRLTRLGAGHSDGQTAGHLRDRRGSRGGGAEEEEVVCGGCHCDGGDGGDDVELDVLIWPACDVSKSTQGQRE